MSIVNELFANSKPCLENFQNTYFEEFFKRSSILQCLKQMRRTVAVFKNGESVVFRDSFVDSLGRVQHTFSEVTKNLQVQFVNRANWFDRKEIFRALETLFS